MLHNSRKSRIFVSLKKRNTNNYKFYTTMKKLTNDQLAMMLLQSAMEQGFELEMNETIEQNMLLAEEYLLENVEADFEQCELTTSGYSQNYYFCDEFGKDAEVSGEIFDFGRYKAESEVYYHVENDGEFKPVDWFKIPMEGEERKEYIFVFDKFVSANGKVYKLYDHLA